jgi:hypothetical protein
MLGEEIIMRNLRWLLVFIAIFALSCGSADTKDESKTLIEKKIEIIREDAKNKEVEVLVGIHKLQEEHGDTMLPFIENQVKKITGNNKNHVLDQFIKSPNRDLKIPSNLSRIHLRNNYPSGNTVIVLLKDGKPVKIEPFVFNTEFKQDLAPGKYQFFMLIDRNFNDNLFVFKSELNLRGGELYIGEFTVNSQLNKSGSCESNEIPDTDMCIRPYFKILDNCDPGMNLVEHLCCPDGFNFIMNGKCSRYSDTVESVVCPAGYHEAGKGRCCPKGTMLIDDKCQEPQKDGADE